MENALPICVNESTLIARPHPWALRRDKVEPKTNPFKTEVVLPIFTYDLDA
jgi:hypothetical protein